MSAEIVSVNVMILDKEYMVSCPPQEKESLEAAARLLNERLRKVRDGGKVLGTERMAVITALNLVYELEQERSRNHATMDTMGDEVRRLARKVSGAVDATSPTS
ncbi:MAG: cell division protein ZapA [Ectothiorhodospiraceae bacterium]|nr:cell division protein ZapA [Chromatiales bacterium]MCP5156766.1 cell division protein ZapA [Ectothiorhodospiraceae bacterium]